MSGPITPPAGSLWGLVAEYRDGPELIEGARRARAAGYSQLDAFSPYPVEGLSAAVGVRPTRLPLLVLLGGIAGGLAGYVLQYWVSVVHYPHNVGGRPLHSWPAFIPVTFECTILAASLTAVVGMIALNGLPRLHHPIFGARGFERASQDRFFLAIEAHDPQFDRRETRAFLERQPVLSVEEVAG